MINLIGGVFLGWGLGANDSANIFGTAVSAKMVRYSTAVILAAIFVVLGAVLQGENGMHTLSSLSTLTPNEAMRSSLAAAFTVALLTYLKLPISTSQAVVGSILGTSIFNFWHRGVSTIDLQSLGKIALSWISTPIGGMIFAFIFYYTLKYLFNKLKPDIVQTDLIIRWALIVAGCYGAYALGANNVANVTGIYTGPSGILTTKQATIIGGISISLGVLTYSHRVMTTVGSGVFPLDAFSALVAVISHSATIHIFAMVGVPVSSSQAIIGALMGIGLIKNIDAIKFSTIFRIFFGWIATPIIAASIAIALAILINLEIRAA